MLPIEEIGKMTGRTASAIQTAASRFRLPQRVHSIVNGVVNERPVPAGGKQRNCLNCEKPYWSDGPGHRHCARCSATNNAMA